MNVIIQGKEIIHEFDLFLEFIYLTLCVPDTSLQSCSTLGDPLDRSLPGSPIMGFSRQEYWSGLPFSTLEDLPDSGIKPMSFVSPALAGG